MGTKQPSRVTTGILSEGERRFFRGESDVDNPDGYRGNARYRARKRMEQIEEDIEVLEAAGEEDIVEEFFDMFSRDRRLKREVEELRRRLDEDGS